MDWNGRSECFLKEVGSAFKKERFRIAKIGNHISWFTKLRKNLDKVSLYIHEYFIRCKLLYLYEWNWGLSEIEGWEKGREISNLNSLWPPKFMSHLVDQVSSVTHAFHIAPCAKWECAPSLERLTHGFFWTNLSPIETLGRLL